MLLPVGSRLLSAIISLLRITFFKISLKLTLIPWNVPENEMIRGAGQWIDKWQSKYRKMLMVDSRWWAQLITVNIFQLSYVFGNVILLCWERFSSVQLLSCVWFFVTPWIIAHQASMFITNSWSSLKLTSIESVMPSSYLTLCHPLVLLPPISPSIRVFSNESTLRMRWPKYWSFSFSISPSNEHPGLISFKMDWLDLLAVQGTLKSLPQHHSSKASIFGTQLSLESNSHIHRWPLGKP